LDPSSSIDLSIIILNWNSVGYLKKCLATIKAETNGLSYEIIVIDGASYDGCAEMLSSDHPDVRFIQLHENVGFARANNHAAQFARGQVLLFLNPDTEIREQAITRLYAAYTETSGAGAAGTTLLNSDNSLQTSAVQAFPAISNQIFDFDFFLNRFPMLPLWGNAALYQAAPAQVQVVSGACLMVRKSVFQEVGGFNTSYFMYAEDSHLCWDIRRKGYKVMYLPGGKIVHFGGGSSSSKGSSFSSKTFRNSIYIFLKHTRGRHYAELYRYSMWASAIARLSILNCVRAFKGPSLQPSIDKWRHVLSWAQSPVKT
jgi:GT2 family glycosyltransferase